jgi:hypothetical protein
VGNSLNQAYPAVESFPTIRSFMQSFQALVAQIEGTQFQGDYRPAQSDCPAELQAQLILRGKLLRVKGPVDAGQREALGALFPSNPNQAATQRLIDDFLDQETLDILYRGWFVQEAVSQLAPLDPLPPALRALVDYPDPNTIRYHGVMTRQEGQALQALFSSIQRLYARSVSRGLHGSALAIMARRGSAAPSSMRELEASFLAGQA